MAIRFGGDFWLLALIGHCFELHKHKLVILFIAGGASSFALCHAVLGTSLMQFREEERVFREEMGIPDK